MKKRMLALGSVAAVILTGCVVTSVHPYYLTKDVQYQPALVGQWTNAEASDECWTFEKQGSEGYRLDYLSNGKHTALDVRFFKLNGQSFLDLGGLDKDCDIAPPPVPSHLLLRVNQLSPTVQLAPLNHDWLKSVLQNDPKALRHLMIGNTPDDQRVVLTADTTELQHFLVKHLEEQTVWKDRFELKRK
ncbi:MAG TPA: hypothetical protein VL793_01110 [Patescibacteria group bacterium]|nr:hypothetical protein [Patescibacteria group bacterium]